MNVRHVYKPTKLHKVPNKPLEPKSTPSEFRILFAFKPYRRGGRLICDPSETLISPNKSQVRRPMHVDFPTF